MRDIDDIDFDLEKELAEITPEMIAEFEAGPNNSENFEFLNGVPIERGDFVFHVFRNRWEPAKFLQGNLANFTDMKAVRRKKKNKKKKDILDPLIKEFLDDYQ